MAQMPTAISVAPAIRLRTSSCGRRRMNSAIAETPIAMISDSSVVVGSKANGTGKWNASIPMKCIDQMPVPKEMAPATSHAHDFILLEPIALTRPAKSSAVYDAIMATATESATKRRS